MTHHVTLNRLPTAESALDFAPLHQLRHQVRAPASTDTEKADAEVARQFEALFIAQLLKQTRQASEASGMSFFDNPQTQMVQGMGDAQLAQQLATPGIGLAQVLLAQMRRATGNVLGDTDTAVAGSNAPSNPTVSPTSRLPANAPTARPHDAASITELITKLTQQASAVVSAIREAPQHIHAFVQRLSKAAHLAAQDSGVPAKLILSQAALESGWGHHEIRHADGTPTHNVFGIKATANWRGKVAHVTTTEYVDGQARRMTQAFRAYDSYEAACRDYARLMGQSPRYHAVRQATTAEDAARHVQQAGYASDPAYADKLIRIMGYLQQGAPKAWA